MDKKKIFTKKLLINFTSEQLKRIKKASELEVTHMGTLVRECAMKKIDEILRKVNKK